MSSAIVRIGTESALAINNAVDRHNTLVAFVGRSLRDSVDYGKIPGCGDKPVLFKPGAEKIATLFGLRSSLERLEAVKDFTGKDFGGEPFFSFEYKVSLRDRSGEIIAECIGSCNSWEDKYRWRSAERRCPECGSPSILQSREANGGWFCWQKKGGCGARFAAKDQSIVGQQTGRVANERIFDQVNTIDKMAQKRAFVGAVILAANASNYFAVEQQEIESIDVIDADYEPSSPLATIERIEVIDDGGNTGAINRDQVKTVLAVTELTWADVRAAAESLSYPVDTSAWDAVQLRRVIHGLLFAYGLKRRPAVDVQHWQNMISKLERPNLSVENLANQFWVCVEEMAQEAPLSQPEKGQTFQGKSIE